MTPGEHRDTAVQLLADVADRPESPGEARVLTQAAIAHALLGLLELQLSNPGPTVVNNLAHPQSEQPKQPERI